MPSRAGRALVFVALAAGAAVAAAEPPTAAALIERSRREKSPVWADGDRATFFYRGEADGVEVLFGGDVKPLTRLAESDVWTLTVTLADLEHAVFSYSFFPTINGKSAGKPAAGGWRGPKAPPGAVVKSRLSGKLEECVIDSKALGGKRKLTVYLPPGHDVKKPSRVVYAADGQSIAPFARVLEPLVEAGRVVAEGDPAALIPE